jgi:alpha-glucosidase
VRVPMPWSGDEPPFGFSGNPDTWLPIPPDWAQLTVERQLSAPHSTLNFFRLALALRRAGREFEGTVLEWLETPPDALAFRVVPGGLLCVLNAGARPIKLPPGEVLLASAPLIDNRLPPDTAAWLV